MEFKDIKELILLVNATEITDFEMEAGDLRICIRKGQGDTAPIQVSPQDPALAFSDVGPASKGSLGLEAVVAPMVGTFTVPQPKMRPRSSRKGMWLLLARFCLSLRP